ISAFKAQLKEYQEAKEVTRIRLYLESVEKVLSGVGQKTIIGKSVRGPLPLLDLDRDIPARNTSSRTVPAQSTSARYGPAAAALKGTQP
ncbi:MAG: hypothetical protein V3R99_02515, partial [Thermoguttaceae bacterium]